VLLLVALYWKHDRLLFPELFKFLIHLLFIPLSREGFHKSGRSCHSLDQKAWQSRSVVLVTQGLLGNQESIRNYMIRKQDSFFS